MKLEMIYLIIPICAFLSQLGGSDYAPKAFRRFGIPLVMGAAVWYFAGWSWMIPLMMVTQWGASTLPFTLKGDGIPEHTINWYWIWLWAWLKGVSVLWISLSIWPAILICGGILALCATLSNVKATSKYFQWKFVEMGHGAVPSICLALSLTIQ